MTNLKAPSPTRYLPNKVGVGSQDFLNLTEAPTPAKTPELSYTPMSNVKFVRRSSTNYQNEMLKAKRKSKDIVDESSFNTLKISNPREYPSNRHEDPLEDSSIYMSEQDYRRSLQRKSIGLTNADTVFSEEYVYQPAIPTDQGSFERLRPDDSYNSDRFSNAEFLEKDKSYQSCGIGVSSRKNSGFLDSVDPHDDREQVVNHQQDAPQSQFSSSKSSDETSFDLEQYKKRMYNQSVSD